ncbi:MAG TPA: hypothetical protein VK472_02660 [Allosphingosinicella sp.]|nr:hypothetical protein [Allosphingosinicella sp.]
MIRKPPGADRPTALRRGAEVAIQGQRAVSNAGRAVGHFFQTLILGWLCFVTALGALTAASFGGMIIGLCFSAGFGYLLYYLRKRRRRA